MWRSWSAQARPQLSISCTATCISAAACVPIPAERASLVPAFQACTEIHCNVEEEGSSQCTMRATGSSRVADQQSEP